MCSTTKVIFFLAVAIYICAAQLNKSQTCLCQDGMKSSASKFGIKDVTIYPATTFCNKVEIIVSTKNNSYFCLKPKAVTRVLANIMRSKATSRSDITEVRATATPSINTTNV